MRCIEVREQLVAFPGDGEDSLAVRRHLAGCADCRAEQQQFVALRAGLADLGARTIEPPADLVRSLMSIPAASSRSDVVRRHVTRNRRAYVGGAVVAAAGAGALVWRAYRVRAA